MNRIVQNFPELLIAASIGLKVLILCKCICFPFQRYFSDDSKVPVLIVGNKADMTAVRQDYILQPEAFCAKHRVLK